MIDFSKLSDPKHIENARRERAAAEAAQAATDRRRRAAIRMLVLEDHIHAALSDKERRFVRSVENHINISGFLTDPQHNWLFDIAKRFGTAFESVPGLYAFSLHGRLISVHDSGLTDRAAHTSVETLRTWASQHGVSAQEADNAFAGHLKRAALAPARSAAAASPSCDA
ncbi:hypothetical protein [Cupriavidus sp. TMH.W2]|uniref:hypothetical protein n=1 Tax=Cupriavidus sp. TMH.W2 TaxID=3434465 RepID=UPI003D77F229